jgi:choline dehydrogenase-like flavoprotein
MLLGPRAIRDRICEMASVGSHHLGTTRMASDPAKGVVDANCRVHGMANLYVASSSVFATSSYARPTLTAVALAIRLADHLKGLDDRTARRTGAVVETVEFARHEAPGRDEWQTPPPVQAGDAQRV